MHFIVVVASIGNSKSRNFLTAFLLLIPQLLFSQSLTLEGAESLFRKNNLELLAAHFGIDAANASIIQAKLWQNPVVYGEINAIDPSNNRVFHDGRSGEKVLVVQQLIYIGGKKRNEIELAKSNSRLALLEFEDLLRQLKYRLRVNYYSIYFDEQTIINLEKQLAHVNELIEAYNEQAEKGNVPFKDIVRLQSFYMELQNEKTRLREQILEDKKNLKVLLGTSENIILQPTPGDLKIEKQLFNISLDTLLAQAIENRPDILIAKTRVESGEWNLKWQKSLAIPDITIGGFYDQRGGAFLNQVNLTLGIPLPVLNQNQGSIKMAQAYLSQSEKAREQLLLEVKNEVKMTYEKYIQSFNNYQAMLRNYNRNFDLVYIGMLKNFQKRNVSLLEFIDFMESYNNTISHVNEIKKKILQSYEEMNLVITQDLFK